ncbi:hypothetical protein ACS0PU_006062 [Formica fusca]
MENFSLLSRMLEYENPSLYTFGSVRVRSVVFFFFKSILSAHPNFSSRCVSMHRRRDCDCDCDGCGGYCSAMIILTIRWARAMTFECRRHVAANEQPTMHVSSRCECTYRVLQCTCPAECERALRGSGFHHRRRRRCHRHCRQCIRVTSVRGSSNREERSPTSNIRVRSDVQPDRSSLGYPS